MIYHIRSKFDAAHMLSDHEGDCRHLHGHTYRVVMHIGIPDKEVFVSGKTTMPVDFKKMKNLLDHILHVRDHALLVSERGAGKLFGGHNRPDKIRVFDSEPTAEAIALDLYKALACDVPRLSNEVHVRLVGVTIFETDDQAVTVTHESYASVAFLETVANPVASHAGV